MRRMTTLAVLVAIGASPVGGSRIASLEAQQSRTRPQSLVPLAPLAPLPAEPEKPFAALSRMILGGRDSLVRAARSQVGARYRLGAMQPGLAFDCSGFVKWVAGLFDVELPRTAAQQARLGLEVPRDTAQLLPGDLLFFGHGTRITHTGIYVGGGKYVHAARPGKGVVESDLTRTKPRYWKRARRVFIDADSLLPALRAATTL